MDVPRFDEIVDHATAGLKDDQELRLDVRTELRAHLEDTQRHFQYEEGKDEAESIDLALRTFGSPLDLADKILDANKRRLKLRALFRIMVGTVLVPLAVLVAVWVGYGRWARAYNVNIFQTKMTHLSSPDIAQVLRDESFVPELPSPGSFQRRKQFEEALQRWPNMSRTSLRQYWLEHRQGPESHVYYAYYANYLPLDENFVKEMRRGESIEPQNALYNYRLAQYYLMKGLVAKAEKSKKQAQTDDILDQQAMEQGIAELRKAIAKPYLRDHQVDMLRIELAMLPPPELTEDYLGYATGIAGGVTYPLFARYRNMARKIPGCARVLVAQGRTAEAEELMSMWEPITRHLAEGSDTMTHVLVAHAVGAMLMKESADVYAHIGKPGEAQRLRETVTALADFRKTAKNNGDIDKKSAAQLAQFFPPVFGADIAKEELAPMRYHEYTMVELAISGAVIILLTCTLLWLIGGRALSFLRRRRDAAVPLLLLPPGKVIARILVLGILVPIAVYYLYTRLPGIGGRQYSIMSMWPRYLCEMAALMLVLLYLPAAMAGRWVRRLCALFGIDVPERRLATRYPLAKIITFPILVASGIGFILMVQENYDPRVFYLVLCIVVIALGAWLASVIADFRFRRQYSRFFATMARSLIPVYAIAIILIGMVTKPYLTYSEKKWLREDRIVFPHPEMEGVAAVCSPMEQRALDRYKAGVLKVLDEAK